MCFSNYSDLLGENFVACSRVRVEVGDKQRLEAARFKACRT